MRNYMMAGIGAMALFGGSAVLAQEVPVPPDAPGAQMPPEVPPAPSAVPPDMPPAPPAPPAPVTNVVSNPVTQATPPPPAPDQEYPPCSKTVQDSCRNRGGV